MTQNSAILDNTVTAASQVLVRRVVIVTSPKAGSGLGQHQVQRLLEQLEKQCITAEATPSIGELRDGLLKHEGLVTEGSLAVVAAGGDGTLSLVAQNVPPQVPLIPMPLGTENLLARHFGYSPLADRVLAAIRSGRTMNIDAGLANGRLFLVVASAGFDAEVVRGMHLTRRGHIRRIDYWRPIFRAMRKYSFPDIQVRIDGGLPIAAPLRWAMLFNLPRYAASLAIEPEALGDDGQLDLIGFQCGSVAHGLRYYAGILSGRHRSWSDVIRRRAIRFELTSATRVPYQLDGDYVGRLPLVIDTLPGRVRLLLP